MTTAELELTKTASSGSARPTMKALVYHGPGKRAWEDTRPHHSGAVRRHRADAHFGRFAAPIFTF